MAENIDVPGGFHSEYDAYHNGEKVARVQISVPGEHNILNSLMAFVAAYESGAKVDKILEGLKAFGGAARRFERLGTYCGVTFADDYAHHPAEIKVTLEAAKRWDLSMYGLFISRLPTREQVFSLMILQRFYR